MKAYYGSTKYAPISGLCLDPEVFVPGTNCRYREELEIPDTAKIGDKFYLVYSCPGVFAPYETAFLTAEEAKSQVARDKDEYNKATESEGHAAQVLEGTSYAWLVLQEPADFEK